MAAVVQQDLDDEGKCPPEPPRMITADGTSVPPAFHIPGEHGHHVTVGQIRIPQARIGIALSAGDQQVGMHLHRPLGEGVQQCCFAPAGANSDKYQLALYSKRSVHEAAQLRQLALSADKEPLLKLAPGLFFGEEGRKLGWEAWQRARW